MWNKFWVFPSTSRMYLQLPALDYVCCHQKHVRLCWRYHDYNIWMDCFGPQRCKSYGRKILRKWKKRMLWKVRSSHQRCSVRKGVFRYFAKIHKKHLCLRPGTLLKKRLWYRCLPFTFAQFLRTLLLENTSGGCFWKVKYRQIWRNVWKIVKDGFTFFRTWKVIFALFSRLVSFHSVMSTKNKRPAAFLPHV